MYRVLPVWRRWAPLLFVAALASCVGRGGGNTDAGGSTDGGTSSPTAGEVSLLAGRLSNAGSADGVGAAAQFNLPRALVQDAAGNIYVADSGNHTIRRIAPDGTVTRFAGASGEAGSADGAAASEARFSSPGGLAFDSHGDLYVADTGNHTIRRISTTGQVSTVAGAPGQNGAVNGIGASARFDTPRGLAFDLKGNLLVADRSGALRRVSPSGEVTTFAGELGSYGSVVADGAQARFTALTAVAVDDLGNVIVAEHDPINLQSYGSLRRFDASAHALPWGTAANGVVNTPSPEGLAVRPGGEVIVASSGAFAPVPNFIGEYTAILRVGTDGQWSVLAGESSRYGYGSIDGPAASARFYNPEGVALGSGDRILVADTKNNTVRQIDASGNVSTIAGQASIGRADGSGSEARFFDTQDIGAFPDGTLFVADARNSLVRRVTPAGQVSTQSFTLADGTSFTVQGRGIMALATSADSRLYVNRGFTNTVFDTIESDAAGNARSISTQLTNAMAAAPGGRLYFETGINQLQLLQDGNLSTVASGWQTSALAVDAAGTLYAAGFDNAIRAISDGTVRILAGSPGQAGSADGDAQTARFDLPRAIAVDASQNVYVADKSGIRRITPDGAVVTIAITSLPVAGTSADRLPQALRGGVKGLAWYGGTLYAAVDNAILSIALHP